MTTSVLTSTELNFLVFRYLQESGFLHAAFTLGYEAGIDKSSIDGNLVPLGALITLVQKGLQYVEMEANLDNNDVDCEDDFSFLQPLDLITKSVDELQRMVKAKKKEKIQKEFDKDNVHAQKQKQFKGKTSRGRQKKDGDQEEDKDKMDVDDDQGKVKERVMKMEKQHSQSKVQSKLGKHKVSRVKVSFNTPKKTS